VAVVLSRTLRSALPVGVGAAFGEPDGFLGKRLVETFAGDLAMHRGYGVSTNE
jgi:hypothetical protein